MKKKVIAYELKDILSSLQIFSCLYPFPNA